MKGEIYSHSGPFAVIRVKSNTGHILYVVTENGERISGSFPTGYDAIEEMMDHVWSRKHAKKPTHLNPKYAPREAVHVQGLEGPYRYSGSAGSRGGFLGLGATPLVQVSPVGGGDSIIVPEAAVRALTKNPYPYPPGESTVYSDSKGWTVDVSTTSDNISHYKVFDPYGGWIKTFTNYSAAIRYIQGRRKANRERNPVIPGEVGTLSSGGIVRVTGRAPSKGGAFGFGGQDMVYVEGDVPGGRAEVPRAAVRSLATHNPLPVRNPIYQCPACSNPLHTRKLGAHRCRYCGAGVRIR